MRAVNPAERPQTGPDMVRPERFFPLQDGNEKEQGNPGGNRNGIACADTAHGRNAETAENEQAEQKNRQYHIGDNNRHGNMGHAVRIDDIANRSLQKEGQYAQCQGKQVFTGNMMDGRFQSHKIQKRRQQHIACGNRQHRKKDSDIEALHDIDGNAAGFVGAAKL